VTPLGGEADPATRRLPLTLVVGPPAHLRIMREEIFGPILPVIGYDRLDEALAGINAGERPLGLYVYSKDERVAEDVLAKTTSGGACANARALQGALPSLGFGGWARPAAGGTTVSRGTASSPTRAASWCAGPGGRVPTPYGAVAQAIVDSVFNNQAQADPAAPGGT
jgi:coniferyl-aldehyde dehydrogenase